MERKTISLSDKFLLTFTEASQYFNIGENKLRNMASLEQNPDWIVYNGYRRLIKRVRLEEILLKSETI
ncbi:excisionase [Holdemanella sp. SCCA2]|nr:excisionase [Holdemanella sp. SCCA2]